MKKRITLIAGIVIFAVLLALSVYIPSRDNFSNVSNKLDRKVIGLTPDNMVNWSQFEDEYISAGNSQIILSDIGTYVHTVKLPVQLTKVAGFAPDKKIPIFYTEVIGEEFSAAKRIDAAFSICGDNTYLLIDRAVHSLRIDLLEDAGITLRADHAEINDKSPIIGLTSVSMYCIVPMMLLGVLYILIFCRKSIKPYFLKLRKYIPLLSNLISRDLKVKYRRSVLGFLWSVLNPLLMALVINTVFSRLFRFDVQYFAVYYLAGALIFNFVIECTTVSMTSILDASPLIKKVYIPKYIFPLEKCCFAFVNMLFSSVALVVVMIIQGVPFAWTIFMFPIPMFYAMIFAYGLSLALSALMVFFKDMQHLWSVWTMIWTYLTPILYPEKLLLDNGLGIIMKANPLYHYTRYFRDIVMYNRVPSFEENIVCMMFAGVMLIIGLVSFKKTQDKFILYI